MPTSRRRLLGRSALTGAGALALAVGAEGVTASSAEATSKGSLQNPLFPSLKVGKDGLLGVPRGFSYEVGSISGKTDIRGPSFSPDGLVLFGNVQEPGPTFAIRGPWRRYLG